MPANKPRYPVRYPARDVLRHPRGAKCHHSGSQDGRLHRGRDALLHTPALRNLFQDDRQRGHLPRRIRKALSRRLFAGNIQGSGRQTRTI